MAGVPAGIRTRSRGGGPISSNDGVTKSERRRRVIRTAMALAAEGGYDAVVMRDLADQANVAVGTLYNYFTSKDHLLAAAYLEWTLELEERIASRPPRGATPAERASEVLGRVCEALGRQPRLVSAILTAANSKAPEVAELDAEVGKTMTALIENALGLPDPEYSAKVTSVIEHVMHSALLSWINGRMQMPDVVGAIETSAHLILDDRG